MSTAKEKNSANTSPSHRRTSKDTAKEKDLEDGDLVYLIAHFAGLFSSSKLTKPGVKQKMAPRPSNRGYVRTRKNVTKPAPKITKPKPAQRRYGYGGGVAKLLLARSLFPSPSIAKIRTWQGSKRGQKASQSILNILRHVHVQSARSIVGDVGCVKLLSEQISGTCYQASTNVLLINSGLDFPAEIMSYLDTFFGRHKMVSAVLGRCPKPPKTVAQLYLLLVKKQYGNQIARVETSMGFVTQYAGGNLPAHSEICDGSKGS